MSFAHVDLEGLVSFCLPLPLALTFFLPPLTWGSMSPEGQDLMKISHLGLSVPRPLTLWILSGCGSLYLFPDTAARSFSDDG